MSLLEYYLTSKNIVQISNMHIICPKLNMRTKFCLSSIFYINFEKKKQKKNVFIVEFEQVPTETYIKIVLTTPICLV